MAAALAWGALAASSLVIGGMLGVTRTWPARIVGLVLAFGAGALISAVSFDLAQEGAAIGGPGSVAAGLALGALTYYALDHLVDRPDDGRSGEGVSVGLLVAIFVSNLPEAVGASADLRTAGHRPGTIRRDSRPARCSSC